MREKENIEKRLGNKTQVIRFKLGLFEPFCEKNIAKIFESKNRKNLEFLKIRDYLCSSSLNDYLSRKAEGNGPMKP